MTSRPLQTNTQTDFHSHATLIYKNSLLNNVMHRLIIHTNISQKFPGFYLQC